MRLLYINPHYSAEIIFFEHRSKFAAEYEIVTRVSDYLADKPKYFREYEMLGYVFDSPYGKLKFGTASFVISSLHIYYKNHIDFVKIDNVNPKTKNGKHMFAVVQRDPVILTYAEYFKSRKVGSDCSVLDSIYRDDTE